MAELIQIMFGKMPKKFYVRWGSIPLQEDPLREDMFSSPKRQVANIICRIFIF